MKIKYYIVLSVCFLLTISGCGGNKNPDGRVDVTGTISLNGKLMDEIAGVVVFDSVNGEPTNSGSAPILKGRFHMTGNAAPKPGKFIVRITGLDYYDKRTNARRTAETTGSDEMIMQVIPNEFNVNSNIEFEVVKGKRNIFNYNVITDFKPARITKK
ncbi:MAG: hypothetical protein LBK06_01640 [Planctomycetaceae bacterium]|jgi:hypothetical protein|nr:hypothetical protein [Planctomycetaceae bacterium]